jgi:anti-anti-sigma factor
VEVGIDRILRTSDATKLVVDVSELSYCDAAGLNVLAAAHVAAAQRGKTMVLANPQSFISRIFEVVRFDQVVTVEYSPGDDDGVEPSGGSDLSEST